MFLIVLYVYTVSVTSLPPMSEPSHRLTLNTNLFFTIVKVFLCAYVYKGNSRDDHAISVPMFARGYLSDPHTLACILHNLEQT
jgi:hypothetical protein